MTFKYPINLSKGLTAVVVMAMMMAYGNFSIPAWIYLALHGSYGFLWLLKDRIFPDRQWEQKVSMAYGVFVFVALALYWLPGWWLISTHHQPAPAVIGAAVALNMFGVMLHFSSDAQKYFTLKYKPGLITEGFFARCRNTNYLGELMIYTGFAILSGSWIGFIGITGFFIGAFVPNMIKKDRSLSRYPEFAQYKKQARFLIPRLIRW
jgi:protein-S-isoprenylcysteine O-methyltransferase Ste14